jgi:Phage P22-like portal protein
MAMKQTQKLRELHADSMAEFDRVYEAQRQERQQALEDRRFYSIVGAMWEGQLGAQLENRPKVEVNKIHLAVIRLFNEYRNNRITVDFISKDGSDNKALADTCDMLYRADEQDSVAEEAYDNAFEEAVGGGMGAWRLRTCYEDETDEENEHQRVRIEPIQDADMCVYFSLDGTRQDKSNASRCWVLTGMTPNAFKAEFGRDATSIERDMGQGNFDWYTQDTVYIAEFYEKVSEKCTIDTWRNPVDETERKVRDSEYEADPDLREFLEATGWELVNSRKIKEQKVRKYIMDGSEILEDCGIIAGTEIPIVPVYGKRWYVDGVERFMGHVRLAKDPQRLKNVQLSMLAYIAATSPIEKPILTPEQVVGHEDRWTNDHIDNNAFLLINEMRGPNGELESVGPMAYTKPPTLSPALATLLQITEMDMADILGNQQMGEKMEANQSGKAVELIQTRLDMQAYIYMSNMAKGVKRSGAIWLSMMRDIAVEKGRKMKGITKQGAVDAVELQRAVIKDGATVVENDFSRAKFDVVADVGPSSDSKRQAKVKGLTQLSLITTDEETKRVLTLSALQAMEDEGMSDLNEWARKKLVAMGVIDPTEEDEKRMAEEQEAQQPDPNAQFLLASAAKEEAAAKKAGSDTVLNLAKAAKTEADTLQVLNTIDVQSLQMERQALTESPAVMGSNGEPAPLPAEQGPMNAQ